ncbi:MAG: AP protein [Gemmatimonadetes bacterium]|nr:AP protein [Gemmatimonadota bacterium]
MTSLVVLRMRRHAVGALSLLAFVLLPSVSLPAQSRSPAVVLIVTDGFRWQEMFGGADAARMDKASGVADTAALRRDFWRETPDARRRAIWPFVWSQVASGGAIWGNATRGAEAVVTNGRKFSYPGYNELLVGFPDSTINSNDDPPNRNVTVLEWINKQPGFKGQVRAFGSWDAFRRIFNVQRAGFPVHAAYDPLPADVKDATLRRMYASMTRPWGEGMSFDAQMQALVLDQVKRHAPRALYVGYGETDEWAHDKRYDLYLRSARGVDGFVEELWNTMRAMPQYKAGVTFIVTTDHGRGDGAEWTDHGRKVDGAERVWIATFGARAPKLGEVTNAARVTQSQVAATVAAALGLDYPKAEARAAKALIPLTR